MEIILKQDIRSLGNAGDVVTVRNGYANNFLIPKGMATLATVSAKKMHAELVKQRAHKEERVKTHALQLAEELKTKEIRIGAKTSATGKIFGSVNTIQIAEALSKKGIEIDRKSITILDEDAIKEVGTYTAVVKLHREVKVEIKFEVFSE